LSETDCINLENVTLCHSTSHHGELNCSPGERLQVSLAMAEGFLAWRNVTGSSPWRAKSRLAECFRSVAMAS